MWQADSGAQVTTNGTAVEDAATGTVKLVPVSSLPSPPPEPVPWSSLRALISVDADSGSGGGGGSGGSGSSGSGGSGGTGWRLDVVYNLTLTVPEEQGLYYFSCRVDRSCATIDCHRAGGPAMPREYPEYIHRIG